MILSGADNTYYYLLLSHIEIETPNSKNHPNPTYLNPQIQTKNNWAKMLKQNLIEPQGQRSSRVLDNKMGDYYSEL